jgi:hypothetical protein
MSDFEHDGIVRDGWLGPRGGKVVARGTGAATAGYGRFLRPRAGNP